MTNGARTVLSFIGAIVSGLMPNEGITWELPHRSFANYVANAIASNAIAIRDAIIKYSNLQFPGLWWLSGNKWDGRHKAVIDGGSVNTTRGVSLFDLLGFRLG
jgi:hypothetical protein